MSEMQGIEKPLIPWWQPISAEGGAGGTDNHVPPALYVPLCNASLGRAALGWAVDSNYPLLLGRVLLFAVARRRRLPGRLGVALLM